MISILEAAKAIQQFEKDSLTDRISAIENQLAGADLRTVQLKFLTGGRTLESVMSKNNRLWSEFQVKYGNRFKKVCEYFKYRKSVVQLVDVTEFIPQFGNAQIADVDE